jgi:hypothetical protein
LDKCNGAFEINTKAAGIVYELITALVCSWFNQVCQLFSTNILSVHVYIVIKFNTVYDGFSRLKAFFNLSNLFALLW